MYQMADFLYCYDHKLLPASFADYFAIASVVYGHDTRWASLFRPIKTRTNVRWFSIKSAGPQIWNAVPLDIRSIQIRHVYICIYIYINIDVLVLRIVQIGQFKSVNLLVK